VTDALERGRSAFGAQAWADAFERAGEVMATYGANWDRLVEVKRRWDPDNPFRSNRNVRP
jgi:FAD/FMN-containing dehydrogenase